MRLFDFNRAPNPRRERMFIAEKGLQVARENQELLYEAWLMMLAADASVPGVCEPFIVTTVFVPS